MNEAVAAESRQVPKVSVDIWSDVMCPWCAIGYAQFARARKELEGEVEVEVRWMPFELNPEMPKEGKPQAEHLAEVYDRSAEEVAEMRAQLLEVANRAGFSMDYDGDGAPPEPMMWNTFEAHKLLRWALADQGAEAQSALSLALFRAHFQQRRNVGKREVLLDIAGDLGFDRARAKEALEDDALEIAVRMEETRAIDNNIRSVPSFVINGKYLVPGAQEPEVYRETIRRVVELTKQEATGS